LGPYRISGDAGINTPPDWTRIDSYANDFIKSPMDTGNTNSENLDIWTGYRYTIDSLDTYPVWQGIKMEAAAFKYLLYKDTTYGNKVKHTILAQIRFNSKKNIGYNVATWPKPNGQKKPNYESGVNEALWLTRLLYSYDYTKELFTSTEKVEAENYFNSSAHFFSSVIDDKLSQCFPNRLKNDFLTRSYMASPNGVPQWGANAIYISGKSYPRYSVWKDGFVYTHRNSNGTLGNKITQISLNYNNRMFDKMAFVGMCGILTSDTNLVWNAKQTAKEWIIAGVWPDGTYGEYERNGDYTNPNQGAMLYGSKDIQFIVNLADALARRGDYSIYEFSTKDGVHGTEIPISSNSKKSLKTILDRYSQNAIGNPDIYYGDVAPLNRIDINNEIKNTQFTINHVTFDYNLSISNKYYKSNFYESVYTRDPSYIGTVPYPTVNLSSAGKVWIPWSGTGAEKPGVLFMFSKMEKINPYRPKNAPLGISVTDITSKSARIDLLPQYSQGPIYKMILGDSSLSVIKNMEIYNYPYTIDSLKPNTIYNIYLVLDTSGININTVFRTLPLVITSTKSEIECEKTIFFPNPVLLGDPINISGIWEESKIEIYNSIGFMVYSKSISAGSGNIEIKDFIPKKSGIFLVKIKNKYGKSQSSRLIFN